MAITLRALGASTTGTTSLVLPQPTGTATGDTLVAFTIDHATSGNTTAPTGWTRQGGIAGTGGRFQVFTAVVGQNGLTGTSWTWASLTTRSVGRIIGYYGAINNYTLVMDVASSSRLNASTVRGTLGVTTVHDGAMVIAAYASLANGTLWSAESVATSPTLVERGDAANSTYCSLAIADGIKATAGATGASTATMATAVANEGILVALRPPDPPAYSGTATESDATAATSVGSAGRKGSTTASCATGATSVGNKVGAAYSGTAAASAVTGASSVGAAGRKGTAATISAATGTSSVGKAGKRGTAATASVATGVSSVGHKSSGTAATQAAAIGASSAGVASRRGTSTRSTTTFATSVGAGARKGTASTSSTTSASSHGDVHAGCHARDVSAATSVSATGVAARRGNATGLTAATTLAVAPGQASRRGTSTALSCALQGTSSGKAGKQGTAATGGTTHTSAYGEIPPPPALSGTASSSAAASASSTGRAWRKGIGQRSAGSSASSVGRASRRGSSQAFAATHSTSTGRLCGPEYNGSSHTSAAVGVTTTGRRGAFGFIALTSATSVWAHGVARTTRPALVVRAYSTAVLRAVVRTRRLFVRR